MKIDKGVAKIWELLLGGIRASFIPGFLDFVSNESQKTAERYELLNQAMAKGNIKSHLAPKTSVISTWLTR